MTNTELKKAISENDNKAIINGLSPLLDALATKLVAGTLKKNVVRFLNNNGITGDAAVNLVDIATVRAANLTPSVIR